MPGHSQFSLLKQRRFLPYFVVEILGAFNDNIYRQAIIGMLGWLAVPDEAKSYYETLAPAIFILPYLLFSAYAGQIAEKLEKQRLILITTTMEIAIMSLAAAGFLLHSLPILLIALFATGAQSTLFGPVKYSILPSVLKPEELTGGNGLVEMGTQVSILAGMIAGGLIFEWAGAGGPWVAGSAMILLAVAGNLVAQRIPRVDAGQPDLQLRWNPLRENWRIWQITRHRPAVGNAVLGISWFWLFGALVTSQLPRYAEANLGGTHSLYLFALALFSVGVGTGSMLCEKLSGRIVELGLVPFGAFGMSALLLDLYCVRPGEATVIYASVMDFIRDRHNWRVIVDLTGIGLFAGFYIVPLYAVVQSRTPKSELARTFARLNIQNALFIFAQALVVTVLTKRLGWSFPQVFLALAICTAAVAIYIFTMVPEFLMRFLVWLFIRLFYRIRLHGIEKHVPDEGPAVLVCNHVTLVDALLLSVAIPRPTRFVMHHRIFHMPVLRWIFRTARAIPIAGSKEDPAILQRAFDLIDAELADGNLVCVFPEGSLTTDGQIAQFRPGVERILARRPVPVVPLALKGMWTSRWSRRDRPQGSGLLARLRMPRRLRARVEIVAGPPVDGAIATAPALEAIVRELRGAAA